MVYFIPETMARCDNVRRPALSDTRRNRTHTVRVDESGTRSPPRRG